MTSEYEPECVHEIPVSTQCAKCIGCNCKCHLPEPHFKKPNANYTGMCGHCSPVHEVHDKYEGLRKDYIVLHKKSDMLFKALFSAVNCMGAITPAIQNKKQRDKFKSITADIVKFLKGINQC